jgi:chloramphenicol 3-O-phosphotransferase
LIVARRADPQTINSEQKEQYSASVRACCALARSFAESGYDVAIDDVLEPLAVTSFWISELKECDVRVVILHPRLDVVLARGLARKKYVAEHHVRNQHAAVGRWSSKLRVDSSDLSVEETLHAVSQVLDCSQLFCGLNDNGV